MSWIREYFEIGTILYIIILCMEESVREPVEIVSTLVVIPFWPFVLLLGIYFKLFDLD